MFTFMIRTTTDAFRGDPAIEVSRLLRRAADKVTAGQVQSALLDVNGNNVGRFEFTEDPA